MKSKPERFQNADEQFDVIFTVEERIYDTVLEGSYLSVLTVPSQAHPDCWDDKHYIIVTY